MRKLLVSIFATVMLFGAPGVAMAGDSDKFAGVKVTAYSPSGRDFAGAKTSFECYRAPTSGRFYACKPGGYIG